MKRTPRGKVDPIEHQIELALRPGVFIGDRECFAFVSRRDEIAIQISKLVGIDTGRATSLYEAFLAGCHEKAGEVDDSSGSFGQFAQDLICGWIRARASNPDADETATRLLAWMEDDPFAFCYQIEKDVAKAFNKAGLAAFEKHIRKRFEEAVAAKPAPDTPLGDQPDYVRKHWSEVLRTIYATQRNVAAYIQTS